MSAYYTGPIRHLPMSQATKPFRWTPDGNTCVGSNGVPVFGVACGGQPRPDLKCPPGLVVGGVGSRFCTIPVPASLGVPYYSTLRNLGPGWINPDLSNHGPSSQQVPKADTSIQLLQRKLSAPVAPSPMSGSIGPLLSQARGSSLASDPQTRDAFVLISIAILLVVVAKI